MFGDIESKLSLNAIEYEGDKDKTENDAKASIDSATGPDFLVLPVYAALPFESQCQIFDHAPKGVRKVERTCF